MSAMLWRLHDAMQPWSGHPTGCAICGETEFSPDVEAFETTGKLICSDCATDDDGQPDEQQEWSDYDPDC